MDPVSIALALVSAQLSQVQTGTSAAMLRMNADASSSVAGVLDAAAKNAASLANVAAGVGQNVNISA